MSNENKPWLARYDDYVPHTLAPYPDIAVPDMLSENARLHPDTPAIIQSTGDVPLIGRIGRTISYRQLKAEADALGAALLDMGLQKGDRVALLMANCSAYVTSWYGVLGAGLVAVGINPTYPSARLKEMLKDCGAKAIITMSLFYKNVQAIRNDTQLEQVIVTNIKEGFPRIAAFLFTIAREKKDGHRVELEPNDHMLRDLLVQCQGKTPQVTVTKEDVAIFQYTGGTTGPSKAAVSTHGAIVANTLQQQAWLSGTNTSGESGVVLGALPFYHVFGMISVIAAASRINGTIAIVIDARNIADLLDIINTYKPRVFHGVPALFNAINANELVLSGQVDLSSIQYCLSGSAPLPKPTKDKFESISKGKLIEGYGMSEAPTATHANPLNGENRAGSVGLPLPDTMCKIVSIDDYNDVLPQGEVGEIAISGPQLMLHYHERPTETANTIVTDNTGTRWLLTGDIGYMDADGYFHIVDRKKDMALIGGYNVYPNQVDQVLNEHPAVVEVAVAVIPHPEKEGQEALKAWVVLAPGKHVSAEDLMQFAGEKLARYEIPSRYEFVDALPRSAVGKILRRELVQRELNS